MPGPERSSRAVSGRGRTRVEVFLKIELDLIKPCHPAERSGSDPDQQHQSRTPGQAEGLVADQHRKPASFSRLNTRSRMARRVFVRRRIERIGINRQKLETGHPAQFHPVVGATASSPGASTENRDTRKINKRPPDFMNRSPHDFSAFLRQIAAEIKDILHGWRRWPKRERAPGNGASSGAGEGRRLQVPVRAIFPGRHHSYFPRAPRTPRTVAGRSAGSRIILALLEPDRLFTASMYFFA